MSIAEQPEGSGTSGGSLAGGGEQSKEYPTVNYLLPSTLCVGGNTGDVDVILITTSVNGRKESRFWKISVSDLDAIGYHCTLEKEISCIRFCSNFISTHAYGMHLETSL
ncbi:MAG TPA: hypothetical protein VJ969_10230 [Desulfopila sp.]|nr:hypothetical protein [Desulfopila sp.]